MEEITQSTPIAPEFSEVTSTNPIPEVPKEVLEKVLETEPTPETVCESCSGTGRKPGTDATCETCEGTGK